MLLFNPWCYPLVGFYHILRRRWRGVFLDGNTTRPMCHSTALETLPYKESLQSVPLAELCTCTRQILFLYSADFFCFNLLSQSVSSIVITYSYGFRKARTPNHDTVKLNTIKNLSKIWNDDEKNDSYNKLISIDALLSN